MDKLIELLNEYDDNNWEVTDYGALFNRMNEGISETEDLQVISKKFGFIGWLVQNDKIDLVLDSIIHKHKGIDFDTGKGIVVEKLCDRYESLLMLLAIQDNPIKFLVSVIK